MEKVTLLPGERVDRLESQNIQIIQHPDVFSFSLDAVMLANFAQINPKRTKRVVDLCAGNGAVGLFLAHRTSAQIDLVEIQSRLADMAQRSIELNELTEQLTVHNIDLADTTQVIAKDQVDVVTVNPPYFADQPASQKNPNDYLAIARHELLTTLEQVVVTSSDLLKMNGKLFMVHRPDRLLEIMATMTAHRLAPKEIQLVYPKAGQEANMVLISAIKDGKPGGIKFLPPIMTYDEHGEYTDVIKEMLYGK